MLALREIQRAFYDAIFIGGAEEELLIATLEEEPAIARRRFAAYRRSICGNLNAALLATYPVVANIVGMPFFREAARQYVQSHPSLSGDLNEYGGAFSDFLAGYPHARDLAYLPDVARLEWCVQQVFYARDPQPTDLSILAATPPERYGYLHFQLSPACVRLDSVWPLHDIWRVNQPDFDGDMHIDFTIGAQVLVRRRNGLVQVEALSSGEAALFDALKNGQQLGIATSRAFEVDPGFDLVAALHKLAVCDLLLLAEHAGNQGATS